MCGVKTEGTCLSAVSLSLFLTTPLLELHASHVHDGGGDLVYVILLGLGEAQNVEGLLLGHRDCVSFGLAEVYVSFLKKLFLDCEKLKQEIVITNPQQFQYYNLLSNIGLGNRVM